MALVGMRRAASQWLTRAAQAVQPTRMQAASYRAAQADRWSGDWSFGASSMTQILRVELGVMRDKSRDLVMNNATAARLPTLFSENVSGKDGILYQAAVMGADGNPDAGTNRVLESGWYRWAEDAKSVTADQRLTWQEVEQLSDESECTDGETLVRLLPGFRNKWKFAIQVLDPDQLDLTYNIDARPGQNAIVMGIEVDVWGAAVAFHLWPNHPSEQQKRGERLRVPASQMLHNFIVRRAGQMRGVPWLAPVMADLMHLGKYREAEVMAARLSAAKMGFIKGGTGAGTTEQINAAPGEFVKLGENEEPVFWDPNHPNGNHAAFERAVLHSVAGAARVSYMSLSGDLSQTSFASGQMGWMGEKAVYQTLQQRRIMRYSRPVHRLWLEMAMLAGQLDVRGRIDDLAASDWRPRPFMPIDALKSAKTDALNLALGKTSLTNLVEAEGGDLRKVLLQRQAEIELARELGVPLYLPVGSAVEVGAEEDDLSPAPAPAGRSAAMPSLEKVA